MRERAAARNTPSASQGVTGQCRTLAAGTPCRTSRQPLSHAPTHRGEHIGEVRAPQPLSPRPHTAPRPARRGFAEAAAAAGSPAESGPARLVQRHRAIRSAARPRMRRSVPRPPEPQCRRRSSGGADDRPRRGAHDMADRITYREPGPCAHVRGPVGLTAARIPVRLGPGVSGMSARRPACALAAWAPRAPVK